MPNITITANTRTAFDNADAGPLALAEWIQQIANGQVVSDAMSYTRSDDTALGTTAYLGQAAGLFLLDATAEDAVSADVCGETVEVDAGSSPGAANSIVAQTAWCALVRSTATINNKVTACNRTASITLDTVLAGETVQVCGQGFVAVDATPTEVGTFDMGEDNTGDALSLATAINQHPSLVGRCRAVSVADVVYVSLLEDRTPTAEDEVVSFAATMVVANEAFAYSAVGMVLCLVPGPVGNECRLSDEAGTGATIATNGTAGFLGQGTGGGTSLVWAVP